MFWQPYWAVMSFILIVDPRLGVLAEIPETAAKLTNVFFPALRPLAVTGEFQIEMGHMGRGLAAGEGAREGGERLTLGAPRAKIVQFEGDLGDRHTEHRDFDRDLGRVPSRHLRALLPEPIERD